MLPTSGWKVCSSPHPTKGGGRTKIHLTDHLDLEKTLENLSGTPQTQTKASCEHTTCMSVIMDANNIPAQEKHHFQFNYLACPQTCSFARKVRLGLNLKLIAPVDLVLNATNLSSKLGLIFTCFNLMCFFPKRDYNWLSFKIQWPCSSWKTGEITQHRSHHALQICHLGPAGTCGN